MNYKEAIVKLIRKHNGKDMGDLQHSVDLAKELVGMLEDSGVSIPLDSTINLSSNTIVDDSSNRLEPSEEQIAEEDNSAEITELVTESKETNDVTPGDYDEKHTYEAHEEPVVETTSEKVVEESTEKETEETDKKPFFKPKGKPPVGKVQTPRRNITRRRRR